MAHTKTLTFTGHAHIHIQEERVNTFLQVLFFWSPEGNERDSRSLPTAQVADQTGNVYSEFEGISRPDRGAWGVTRRTRASRHGRQTTSMS